MDKNVLEFDNSAKRLISLAEKEMDNENHQKALRYLFGALKKEYSSEVLSDIATVYSEMDLYELSNKYWIKYMNSVPESSWGEPFEQMAINYFCLDNYLLATYFFNKKINVDGVLKTENLSDEILDYFSSSSTKKSLYKIAYPFNEADYSAEIKKARTLMADCLFKKAIAVLDSIPKGAKEYYQALDEKSLAIFLGGDVDSAIDINRTIIKENGESISTLCNLSSMYTMKGDGDKARYYYYKALETPRRDDEEVFKLATCSLEVGEHDKAIVYLEKILDDRPYEISLKYLLGLAYINSHEYKKAKDIFYELYTLSPDNVLHEYYLQFSAKMEENNQLYEAMLPLAYEENLPNKEIQKCKKRIEKYLTLEVSTMRKKLTSEQFLFDTRWAFRYGDEESCKKIAFILVSVDDKRGLKLALDLLSDYDLRDSVKGALLFSLIINGYNGTVGISCSNFYNRIKIRKLSFQNNEEYAELFLAYALLLTKLAFLEIDDFDKIAFSTNKVYKRFSDFKALGYYKKEEIAGLILYLCNFKRFDNLKEVARMMRIKADRLNELIALFQGEKDDKNN